MSDIQPTSTSSPDNVTGGHAPTEHPHGLSAAFLKIMGVAPMAGGEMAGGITRLLSGYSSAYLVPINDAQNEFLLIDAGADADAEEILAVLRYKGLDASAVKAIFLTHGHNDHTAGIHKFKDAEVYVGAGDHDFVEGIAASDGFLPHLSGKQPNIAVANPAKLHTIEDNQTIAVGNRRIRAFAAPGHTHGGMVYLLGDMLFVGDATTFGHHGEAQKPPVPVSDNVEQEVRSLAHLAELFEQEGIAIATVIPGHSGEGSWEAVRKLVADQ